jgi:signal transduction histidine kinase
MFVKVSNALKFTHYGKVVLSIRQLRRNGGETAATSSSRLTSDIMVEVCDTGMGVGELQQKHLFQKYQQLQCRETKQKGTGLGLVIAQRIAALLCTTIVIESPWRNGRARLLNSITDGSKGARFHFTVTDCVVRGVTQRTEAKTPCGKVWLPHLLPSFSTGIRL